jgi:ASC-1-like (ASCH) protein
MTTHKLKIRPEYYDAVASGEKCFEVRFNDRGYQKGDVLVLTWYDPLNYSPKQNHPLVVEVVYVHSGLGMADNFVVLGIAQSASIPTQT